MKKSDTFTDRRQDAEAARIRRVEKFKAQPDPNSPEAMARAAARQAESAARSERKAAADLEKKIRTEKIKADAEAAALARRMAEDQASRTAAEAGEAQAILEEASRKAKRDARYASRKSRT